MRAPLKIKLHERLEDVPGEAWSDLLRCCPDSTVFQSQAWISAWTRCCLPASARILLFAAYRGDRLVGLAPLWLGRDPDQLEESFRVRFLGVHHSDYSVFPAEGGSPDIVNALLDAVDAQSPPGSSIDLAEIPQFSTLGVCLAQRAAHRSGRIFRTSRTACPRLRVCGNESGVRRILRKKSVRRNANLLARLGQVRARHLSRYTEIQPYLELFFDQHVRRWADTPYPSLFTRTHNRHFYCDFVSGLCATGDIVFTVLDVGDRIVAQHVGLRSAGDLLWYKPTFDISLRRCSPGEVMLRSLVEFAQEQSLNAIDFTRGAEPFKARFASTVAYNVSYLWARSLRARWSARARRTGLRLRRALLRSRSSGSMW